MTVSVLATVHMFCAKGQFNYSHRILCIYYIQLRQTSIISIQTLSECVRVHLTSLTAIEMRM